MRLLIVAPDATEWLAQSATLNCPCFWLAMVAEGKLATPAPRSGCTDALTAEEHRFLWLAEAMRERPSACVEACIPSLASCLLPCKHVRFCCFMALLMCRMKSRSVDWAEGLPRDPCKHRAVCGLVRLQQPCSSNGPSHPPSHPHEPTWLPCRFILLLPLTACQISGHQQLIKAYGQLTWVAPTSH